MKMTGLTINMALISMDDIYIISISHIDIVVIAASPAKHKPTQAHTHTQHTDTQTKNTFIYSCFILVDAILPAYILYQPDLSILEAFEL